MCGARALRAFGGAPRSPRGVAARVNLDRGVCARQHPAVRGELQIEARLRRCPAHETSGPFRALCLIALVCGAGCAGSTSGLAEAIATAAEDGRPIPLVTERTRGLSLPEAYAIQRALVERSLQHDRITGFKAAATSERVRDRLGASEPIVGVLFESGRVEPVGEVPLADYRMLLIEAELGFRFREPVTEPLGDARDLPALVAEILLVVELPDGGFETSSTPSAVDLVAANAAAASFIEGPVIPLDTNLADLTVTLEREGQVLARGQPTDTLGDPWEALRWTVQAVLEQGYVIEPGHVVLTGAIGGNAPARVGGYRASLGAAPDARHDVRFVVR